VETLFFLGKKKRVYYAQILIALFSKNKKIYRAYLLKIIVFKI
jgi:hypothetical protein